ncbi:NYN domain-containing protein [Neiella sp. HB171785]|uniref:NYN domain-containing protein n=1 Tax=Neiella litorisoli TaxID=2771431 RepID=A0A8J6UE63_9GAMM|nr:NYN domain-containing protein [Neiella litorisoli]MBD1389264.1 NYN domain-containing protein [Neiella litorisoli]
MPSNGNAKLAVLIDADNAQAAVCEELLAEVSKFGVASVKRAYGDWTTPNLKTWKEHLHRFAIHPVQQFSYTSGKNATDSALIIDAMDLLHEGLLDGFCLVSSDSDFTRLANRLRESGCTVYGFGENKTPEPFVAACDKFVYTEILRPEPDSANKSNEPSDPKLKALVLNAIHAVAKDDGWAPLSAVGSQINKVSSSFDPRNFGYSKLGNLVKSLSYIHCQERQPSPGSPIVHIYIKDAAE